VFVEHINQKMHKPLPRHAKKVFEGIIFSVWQWEQELYDGSQATFERITRGGVTHAVGVLPDGKILMTEDEQPQRGAVITPSGGKIEPGEAPEDAAVREFREETGYVVGELKPWHSYLPASDKISYVCWAYVARDLVKDGEQELEARGEGEGDDV